MYLVSFYTPDYEIHAQRLKRECISLNIENLVLPKVFGNHWIDNVRAKPTFLLDMARIIKDDFIWVDVDTQVLKPLDFKLDKWGVHLREDGLPFDDIHYIPKGSDNFLKMWVETVREQGKGSHTAFHTIMSDYCVIPNGYFKTGISNGKSKQEYFQPFGL